MNNIHCEDSKALPPIKFCILFSLLADHVTRHVHELCNLPPLSHHFPPTDDTSHDDANNNAGHISYTNDNNISQANEVASFCCFFFVFLDTNFFLDTNLFHPTPISITAPMLDMKRI